MKAQLEPPEKSFFPPLFDFKIWLFLILHQHPGIECTYVLWIMSFTQLIKIVWK